MARRAVIFMLGETVLWMLDSCLGHDAVTATVEEYTKFGDVLFESKVTQELAGIKQVITLNTMEFNKVAESVFEFPAQIKPLIKK